MLLLDDTSRTFISYQRKWVSFSIFFLVFCVVVSIEDYWVSHHRSWVLRSIVRNKKNQEWKAMHLQVRIVSWFDSFYSESCVDCLPLLWVTDSSYSSCNFDVESFHPLRLTGGQRGLDDGSCIRDSTKKIQLPSFLSLVNWSFSLSSRWHCLSFFSFFECLLTLVSSYIRFRHWFRWLNNRWIRSLPSSANLRCPIDRTNGRTGLLHGTQQSRTI
jgi:hypothetical protein